MKNFIPLILAVVLGLAAVMAVARLLKVQKTVAEKTTRVVAAARDVVAGDVLTADALREKVIPLSARPAQAIFWSRAETVVGQKVLRSIAQGDYVLLSDVGLSRSMAEIVGKGEWAVALAVPAGGIAKIVQPGDEVAVIATFKIEKEKASADQAAAPEKETHEATLVLFPRVRVLDVGLTTGDGNASGGGDIILSLPPREAQVLVAAQREAEVTLALRRPGDDAAISRIDSGMVDASTFAKLLDGLKPVILPEVPNETRVSNPARADAK